MMQCYIIGLLDFMSIEGALPLLKKKNGKVLRRKDIMKVVLRVLHTVTGSSSGAKHV